MAEVKAANHPFYDCIVPVSGGKDSWFQAMMLAEKYGLKVLCVSLTAHLPSTEGIENLNNMGVYFLVLSFLFMYLILEADSHYDRMAIYLMPRALGRLN